MRNENDLAIKNKRAYAIDTVKIISGAVLSLLLVAVVLINGIKALRNHRKMPEVMLTVYKDGFLVLGEQLPCDAVKALQGKHEFGRTGTVIIKTEATTYNLYGVQNYANAINVIDGIIAKNKKNSS